MRAISLLFHDVYVTNPRESGFASGAADRYKLSVPHFDAQLAGVARVRSDAPVVITQVTGGLKASGCLLHEDFTRRRKAAGDFSPGGVSRGGVPFLFTVDDGGVSYYTVIAERLEARGWRGHCFVTTDAIGARGFLTAAQIRELDARGHAIGSHSASHPARFSACHLERMRREWSRSRQVLEDLLGREVSAASVPGGFYAPCVAHTAREAGLRVLFTSEPTTAPYDESGILVVGRFTIRCGHAADTASRLVQRAPWTRYREWARWRAKGIAKPLLGPAYPRMSEWMLAVGGRQ
ncbi:MAG: polysaccharide deacetylase family protein [Vicinamibacterales bacterium]